MRINEDYIEDIHKDDIISSDADLTDDIKEKHPGDFDFYIAIDFCGINENDHSVCRKKLDKAFRQMPSIKDYLLRYADELPTEDVSGVNIYMDKNFRRISEVYQLLAVLKNIFDYNSEWADDMRIVFFSGSDSVSSSSFTSLIRHIKEGSPVWDIEFREFFDMCQIAMNYKCDPQKCADFIGFDYGVHML